MAKYAREKKKKQAKGDVNYEISGRNKFYLFVLYEKLYYQTTKAI